jgi:hypothetical protein
MYAAGGQNWGNTGWTAGDIYTVAGSANAVQGDAGDGNPATSAWMNAPTGVFTDAAGDLFIADMGNNRIREVPVTGGTFYGQSMTAGNIYTIAGGPGESAVTAARRPVPTWSIPRASPSTRRGMCMSPTRPATGSRKSPPATAPSGASR